MDKKYKKYCSKSIMGMMGENPENGNVLQIYRFFTHNLDYVENVPELKKISIEKAESMLSEIDSHINKYDIGSIKRIRYENKKRVFQEFLTKFQNKEN
jgi:hypothetical protein